MTFTQKYAIISPLEPLVDGQIFESSNWPLHVTLADTFAIDSIEGDFIPQLITATKDSSVKIQGERTAHFGNEKEVEVMLLQASQELTQLHYKIADLLVSKSAVFNDPQYTKSGYIGHVTKQKMTSLGVGESKELNYIALIDMFPGADPFLRKVIKIINIDEAK